jgi:hypothetical protein
MVGRLAMSCALCLAVGIIAAGCDGADTTPPQVTLLSPADGAVVSGSVAIRARATDNSGVAGVKFYVDSILVGEDRVPGGNVYQYDWNVSILPPGGSHVLGCTATDEAGNSASSPNITVTINPDAGTYHSGSIVSNETWSAQDNPHIVSGNLFIEAVVTLRPGVRVLVANGAVIMVGQRGPAGLMAEGRADSIIVITSLSPAPAPGAWAGIQFLDSAVAANCVLRNCVVEYGGSAGALVACNGGSVTVEACTLRYSAGAGAAAWTSTFAGLSGNYITACSGFPVSVDAPYVASIGAGNTLAANSRDGFEIMGGTVAAPDTWVFRGYPYCITRTVTVADSSNPLLVIAAGCTLLFSDSAALRVGVGRQGGLRCDGSYGRIVFAGLAAAPGPGSWRGLEFWENTDWARTALNYCRIENTGAGGSPAVACYSVAVAITNCRIAGGAGAGIYLVNTGFARFQNDTITGCAGYPLHIAAPYVASIGSGNSFTGNASDGIEVVGGVITRDAQWRRQDVPYVVNGTIEVGSTYDPGLTIDPGTTLKFAASSGIAVGRTRYGRLQAVGGAGSITLTGLADSAGAWNGIELYARAGSQSRIENCRILYGGGANRGILFVDSCLPVVRGNEIAYSSNWCVYLYDTPLEEDTVRLYNNLHDWAPGYEDIFVSGRLRGEKPVARRANDD